jgi:hypothetical protein
MSIFGAFFYAQEQKWNENPENFVEQDREFISIFDLDHG